jgi:hypothetical protein
MPYNLKTSALLVLLIMLAQCVFVGVITAQSSSVVEMNKTFGGPESDFARSVVQTPSGGFVIAGMSFNATVSDYDAWIIKMDGSGTVEFRQDFDRPKDEAKFRSVTQTSDGGFALVGEWNDFGTSHRYAWLVKTDSEGNVEINETFSVSNYNTQLDRARSVIETSDGGFVLVGHTGPFAGINADAWLIKTDESGNVEFKTRYGGRDSDFVSSVIETSDGGFALVGGTESFGYDNKKGWIIKTDAEGNKQWEKTFPELDYAQSIINTSDGGFVIAGGTGSALEDNTKGWLMKTDSEGNKKWVRKFTELENIRSLTKTSDGGFVLVGNTESIGSRFGNAWLIKTDEKGRVVANLSSRYRGVEEAYSVIETSDQDFVLTGHRSEFGSYEEDAWIIEVSLSNATLEDSAKSGDRQETQQGNGTEPEGSENLSSIMGNLMTTILLLLTVAYFIRAA